MRHELVKAARGTSGINSRPLPPGWRWARLKEAFELKYGKSLPETARKGGNVPVFGSNGIVGYHVAAITKSPTIVVGRKGSVGEVNFSQTPCWSIDTTYYVDETLQPASLSRLFWQLKALDLPSLNKAAAIPGLNRDDVYKLWIALPPLLEQHAITALLEAQMAEVQRMRQAAERQLEAAQAMRNAYLREVFDGPEARQWPKRHLGTLGDIGSGITLGRKLSNVSVRLVPYLRVANVKDAYLDLSDVYEVEATEAEIEKCRLKFGDLLLTEGGDPDKLGRGTFWEEQILECIHQNHIYRVRFDLNEVSPQFISAQVGSPYGKAYFLAHAKQTTGIATINQKVLAGFPVMLPSLSEQQRVVACLEAQMAEAQHICQAAERQLEAIKALPGALLREVVGGFAPPLAAKTEGSYQGRT